MMGLKPHSDAKTQEWETMPKNSCTGDHQGHLCLLASNDQFDKIKELTRNPEFICFNCGRVADCKENLCNPMPLNE
jgi:hypothetical protein